MTDVRIGQKAPDFEAQAYHNGEFKEVKLSDYAGKWVVLYFYPGDYTFVCTTELATVAAKYEQFKKLDVEVLAVSIDSKFVHKVWNEQELSKMVDGGYPFPMLADTSGKLGKQYRVYDEDSDVDVRGQFIIDPDGVVQALEILTPPIGRDVDELIRQLEAAQYVRDNEGTEVCPASWKPGEKTLKPGPELVGKVWEEWKP